MKQSSTVSGAIMAGFLLLALSLPLQAAAQQKQPAKQQKQPAKQQKQPAKQQKMYEIKKARSAADADRQWHLSAGLRLGCFWWQPVWQKYVANDIGNGVANFKYHMGPNAIFGPMLAFTINKQWSLSWSFLYGRYDARAHALVYFLGYFIPGNIHFKVDKMDSDLLASVALTKYARLFFGPRYQGYQYNEKFLLIKSSPVKYHSMSMGVGAAFTVPLGASFYFLPNLSLVGLVGWEEPNALKISYTLKSTALITGALGFNGNIDFGYYITSASVSITLGLRVQYLYYLQKARPSYGNDADLFIGPNVAAVYTY